MPYFATARSTVRSNLTCRESREIIVQDKFVVPMYEGTVDHLLIVFGPEGHRCQRLNVPASKHRRAGCARQIGHLGTDRAHCTYIATIQTNSFVQDQITNSVVLHIMEVFLHQEFSFLIDIFAQGSEESFADRSKLLTARMF